MLKLKWIHVFLLLTLLATPVAAEPFTFVIIGFAALGSAIGAGLYGLYRLQIWLNKPKPTERGHQDVRLTTAAEGLPIPRVYGTFAVGAKIIDRGSITERKEAQTVGSGKRAVTNFDIRYSTSLAAVVCENPHGNILGISRIWYNSNVLYARDIATLDGTNPPVLGTSSLTQPFIQEAGWARQFQILLGSESQTDRCDWFASGGDDSVPGYRGYVTLWWRDMDLTPSYNQFPQILVEVVSSDDTIADVITRECSLAGINTSTQLTNNAPTDFPIGWFIDGPTPPKQTFEALSMFSPFGIAEVDGKLKAFPIPQDPSATVLDGELGAIETGREEQSDSPIVKFAMTAEQPIEIPQRVEVTVFDANNAYQQATGGFARQYGAATGVQQVFMPMSATRSIAQRVASQMLARFWTERDGLQVSLPPKYIKYHPGDALTIPASNGQAIDMRITTMEFAPGDRINIDGIRQLRLQGLGEPSGGSEIVEPPETESNNYIQCVFVISNCPPAIDDWDMFDGVTWAAGPHEVSTAEPPAKWTGATLFRNACGSDDTNKTYEAVGSTSTSAVIGKARTVLASATGTDTTNTVDIDFPYGNGTNTIVGIPDAAFTATTTANLALVGKEWIQFRDVTDVSASYSLPAGRVWRLGGKLKRGIRDTADMVGTHAVDEAFLLWDPIAVQRVPLNIDEQGGTYNFKAITKGLEEHEINNPVPFTYSPVTGTTVLWVHEFT